MILFKIIFLQLFWLVIVLYGKNVNPIFQILGALALVAVDYVTSRPKVTKARYLFLIFIFTIIGFLNDSSLFWLNLIDKNSYQYGNLSLWIVFLIYYEQIFEKFKNVSFVWISVIGAIAGSFTYWSAANLGALVIIPGMENEFVLSQLIFWAVFFPLSLRMYFEEGFWGKLLDKTVVFSFDKSGFNRHQKKFIEDIYQKKMSEKSILVTGATAGIGAEVAASLSSLGSSVFFTGRNQQRGRSFEKQNPNSKFVSLDMANWREVYEFAKSCECFDHVVFNAGSMPEKLAVNENGIEFQCASQLVGHYYLLGWLKEFNKLKAGARIVWVSSGGMYLKKLDLKNLFYNLNYDKVETYANVKRAQVTLVEELSKKSNWDDTFIYSMHPGWVGTDGLKEALPKFYKLMQNRLRSPYEGADTILWCLLAENAPSSGGLYFDREKVSPYISQKYSPGLDERIELVAVLKKIKPSWH